LQEDHKADLKEALLERKTVEGNLKEAAEGFFLLYANLLSKDAHFRWDKIVASQIGAAPWTDLQGNEHTEPIAAFNKAKLANLLLCMCPKTWQDQYNLSQETTPQSRKLLGVLENVKKVVANSTTKDKTAMESAVNGAGKRGKCKRKGTGSNDI
jgi:hypothetical protein